MAKKNPAKEFAEAAVQTAKRIMNGDKIKYDATKHIAILSAVFSQGEDIAAFCCESNICRDTFFEWVKTHPEFKEAYAEARERSRRYFEKLALQGMQDPLNFNFTGWSMQMRNRFGYTDKRKPKIENLDIAVSHMDKLKLVVGEIAKGELTFDEAVQISNVILAGVKIDESTQMKQDLEMIKEDYLKGKS